MSHRTAFVSLVAGAVLVACAPPPPSDQFAVAPRYDRWEAVVPAPKATVYAAALRVLTDSNYTTATASAEGGVIQTTPRKASDVQRGGTQLRTMMVGNNNPVRLHVVMTPAGADSTRLSISGEHLLENISQWVRIDARSEKGYWPHVAGVGQAILATARPQ